MRIVFKFYFLLLCLVSPSLAGNIDLNEIFKKAEKSHKHVLIFLHKPDCGYCENMIEFTLDDDEVKIILKNNFVYISINVGKSGLVSFKKFKGTKREFAKYLEYDFYPCSIFMNEKKELVYALPGAKEKDKFLKVLRFVKSRSYVDGWLEDFK